MTHTTYSPRIVRLLGLTLLLGLLASRDMGRAAEVSLVETSGIGGGLCVQIGGGDLEALADLARTGRFLVHLLDSDPAAVAKATQSFHAQELYGLVSADRLTPGGRLPYTENLVNLLLIEGRQANAIRPAEMARVLCPQGVLLIREENVAESALKAAGLEDVRRVGTDGKWLFARKPRPEEMDEWSHPRHAADGNAVSRDRLVGPPRRIRWVAGPSQEVSNMVTAAGRNYYAGVLGRDGFNGLQLWQRPLSPSPARGGYNFRYAPGSVRPIAAGERLFVVTDGKLMALDGATGEPLGEYPRAGTPTDVLHVDGMLIAFDRESVRAVQADDGSLRWKIEAVQPRCFAAGDGAVYFIQGTPQRGQKCTAVSLDLATGKVRWRRDDLPWMAEVRRCVCDRDLLAYEVSTFSNDKPNNRIHVVSAADGEPLWSHTFIPGTAHWKQARAMFVSDTVWVLDDHRCVALDRQTGEVKQTHPAGWGHCFPPVATERFLFAGEMNMTALETGDVDANRITKGACGRDAGFVPANGLIYVFPKHCICWPMLRGFAALATARPQGDAIPEDLGDLEFVVERGVEPPAVDGSANDAADDSWPCYRRDAWRSGSTNRPVPKALKTLWSVELGDRPQGAIADDWNHNPFMPGPITPPVIAEGKVFVARGDAHQVVALDAATGTVCWRFTANGRIDTAPTIHVGLCLFGTKSGWVYCLRADDGRMVWRLRAAPVDEQIVAYGQLESPWPVPGSVLVVDDVAFFAAGRQPLADGGILVFAVEPADGKILWVRRLDSVPQDRFYGGLGLEFDNFDLLHREDDSVAMSRWLFERGSGKMRVEADSGFAYSNAGDAGGVMVPRGFWSYAPRNQPPASRPSGERRPLVVFRENTLFGSSEDKRTVYRRDFDLSGGEKFDTVWSIRDAVRKSGDQWRADRLAKAARWSAKVFEPGAEDQQIAAMVLANDTLLIAGSGGQLLVASPEDGKILSRNDLPAPVWDGMAAAAGRVFISTQDGQVVCVGGEPERFE